MAGCEGLSSPITGPQPGHPRGSDPVGTNQTFLSYPPPSQHNPSNRLAGTSVNFRGVGFPKAGLPGRASFLLIHSGCCPHLVLANPVSSLLVKEGGSGGGWSGG